MQHDDAVGEQVDDREVMGDEQSREPELALDLSEQLEHAGLHRYVERARRLVGDQQLRVESQSAREARALALSAGELVREPVAERFGSCTASSSSSTFVARFAGVLGDAVHDERLGDALRRSSAAG